MLLRQISDPRLAQYSYLVGCQRTGEALVIDPERDIDQYIRLAEAEGLRITAVTETHIHADFLSGARAFAERGVRVYLSDEGDADWKYQWTTQGEYDVVLLKDGDRFHVGNIEIEALHTPGHTPEHVSFLVTDRGTGADAPIGIATGDFVFVGDLGRPDLLESAAGVSGAREPSARRLHDSLQRFLELPDFLQLWPGHGAGSACGKALGAVPQSTVGYERRFNAAIDDARRGAQAFVETILAGQTEPPLYFARMKKLNRDGSPVLTGLPAPERVDAGELARVLSDGGLTVIDTRTDRLAFMERHLPRSLYAPFTRTFNTDVGAVANPDDHFLLIIEEADVEQAVRDLVRVGFDHMPYFTTPTELERFFKAGGAFNSIPRVDFKGMHLGASVAPASVLDVRYAAESAPARYPGAQNLAYTRLATRLQEVPDDRRLFVHCASGVRSAVAAALLAREGFDVTYVDGHFSQWAADNPDLVETPLAETAA